MEITVGATTLAVAQDGMGETADARGNRKGFAPTIAEPFMGETACARGNRKGFAPTIV